MAVTTVEPVERGAYELGVGRAPLRVDDLPEPEDVFGVSRIGARETVTRVIGPSLIALGLSIGSGEWLLGPLAIGTEGWVGIGFVILLSILLQAFYNVEIGRYVMATGEVPALGFGRIPPVVYAGTILAVALFYLAFITGGWASGAGDGLFTFIHGDPPATGGDKTQSHWLAVALMGSVFLITLIGRKISRTLELVNWALVAVILVSLLIIDLILVSASEWGDGFEGLFRPALPPKGTDATLIGSVAGFAAMASGLNYVFMNYYRDKGYGMGSRSGYIPGLLERDPTPVEPVGTTFRDTPENERRWSRWYRFLVLEMWLVFVPGAVFGMLFPGILVKNLADKTGTEPTKETMPTFVADQLRATGESDFFFYWSLLVGFLILFTTQLVVFEMLVRNFVDASYGSSAGFRRLVGGDPRRFYYPFMIVLAVVISAIIFSNPATTLVQWSANMSNLAALIFPFAILYLGRKLPRAARTRWWAYPILLLAVAFFGFFFINFFYAQITDEALVNF